MYTPAQSQIGRYFHYCWPEASGEVLCADSAQVRVSKHLKIRTGEQVRFRMSIRQRPRHLQLEVNEALPDDADPNEIGAGKEVMSKTLEPSTSPAWRVSLPKGRYVLSLSAAWKQGSVTWGFGIDVREDARAAPPKGALPTTGVPRLHLWPIVIGVAASIAWPYRKRRARTPA